MVGKEGRRLLAKRLYLELRMFRYSILRKSKKEIFESSYKIELLGIVTGLILRAFKSFNVVLNLDNSSLFNNVAAFETLRH